MRLATAKRRIGGDVELGTKEGASMAVRILSQNVFPGIGKGVRDDCGILATYMATNHAAPFIHLPSVRAFREAAGAPDADDAVNPTDEDDWYRGIRALWPKLAELTTKMRGWTWRAFLDQAKVKGRPAAVIVRSSLLPDKYGFDGIHAVYVTHNDGMDWLVGNPLAKPHSWPDKIDQPTLRAAIEGYQPTVHGILLPTEKDAAVLNPYYVPPATGASAAELELARGEGFAAAKTGAFDLVASASADVEARMVKLGADVSNLGG